MIPGEHIFIIFSSKKRNIIFRRNNYGNLSKTANVDYWKVSCWCLVFNCNWYLGLCVWNQHAWLQLELPLVLWAKMSFSADYPASLTAPSRNPIRHPTSIALEIHWALCVELCLLCLLCELGVLAQASAPHWSTCMGPGLPVSKGPVYTATHVTKCYRDLYPTARWYCTLLWIMF